MFSRFILVLTLSLAVFLSARAETIYVPQNYPTIQAGIDAAVDGDTVLIADGIYTGAGNEGIDFTGKAIVVKSENGPARCIIDIQFAGQGFIFWTQEDTNSVLEGVSVINASYSGASCTNNSSPKLVNVVIANCRSRGISISAANCAPIIDGCLIYHNYSDNFGGGIAIIQGSPAIRSCYIVGNYGLVGGGVYTMNSQPVSFINCYICNNYSNDAGAIDRDFGSGSWSFDNCVFADNVTTGSGGSTFWWYGTGGLSIKNSTFVRNFSQGSSGIFKLGGNINFRFLENCTFYDNRCPNGSSISGNPIYLSAVNCIFWGNSTPAFTVSDSASFLPTYCDMQNGYPGIGNFSADPLFVSPDDWDIRLTENSPCIDAGDPASPLDPDGTITDVGSQYFDQNAMARVLLNSKFRPLFVHEDGGLINIPLQLENLSTASLDAVLWNEVHPMTPVSHNIVWGPQNVTVAPDSVFARIIGQNITAALPFGAYPYYTYAVINGDTISDNCLVLKVQNFPEPPAPEMSSEGGYAEIPQTTALKPPYPNPFNNELILEFQLPEAGRIRLAVYDITGRLTAILEDGSFSAGIHRSVFNGKNLASGIYFIKMQADGQVYLRKAVLIK